MIWIHRSYASLLVCAVHTDTYHVKVEHLRGATLEPIAGRQRQGVPAFALLPPRPHAGADPGFLRGGGPKFEIMRTKYWYVMVTNSDVMRGGGVGGGRYREGRVFPSLLRETRKLWHFVPLLEKEDDSLYRSRLLTFVWI